MASKRLTVSERERIAGAIVHNKYGDLQKELKSQKAPVAEKLYNTLYDKATRDKMNALPDGWLPTSPDFQCRTNNGYRTVDFKNREAKRFLAKHGGSVRLDPDSVRTCKIKKKLLDIIEDFKDKESELRSERAAAYNKALVILNSVTTVNRAIEVWPEAESFILACTGGEIIRNVPAPDLKKFNKQMDLPPKEKAA